MVDSHLCWVVLIFTGVKQTFINVNFQHAGAVSFLWYSLTIYSFLVCFWWLVERHLSGCFCPKSLGDGGRDLQMLCQSASAVWVVSTLIGGWECSNLNCYNSIHLNLLHLEAVGIIKHYPRTPTSHLVKLSLPNIFSMWSEIRFSHRYEISDFVAY